MSSTLRYFFTIFTTFYAYSISSKISCKPIKSRMHDLLCKVGYF